MSLPPNISNNRASSQKPQSAPGNVADRTDTFAIIHSFPHLKNAEYEVLQRMLIATVRIGKKAIVIDNFGIVLWASPGVVQTLGEQINPDRVSFVISLHFESPRVVDQYSYYALWQPTEFYYDHGYKRTIDSFSSHCDLLSCASDTADNHALNVMNGLRRRPVQPLPRLFHCPPEPFATPRIDGQSRLFYIGINWERIGRPKGRFHDTLVALDEKRLTRIYGPELIAGVAPWAGFSTYEGELPFDGSSVLRSINEAGICLALSSAQHKNSGVMSNRLFEGLAGGAAVIATPHPLIEKMFSEAVYLVDDSRGDAHLTQQIIAAMREIRNNPEEATRRTLLGQQILRDQCIPEHSLLSLFADTPARVESYRDRVCADANVTVILVHTHGTVADLANQLTSFKRQLRARIIVHVICDPHVDIAALDMEDLLGGAVGEIRFHGSVFSQVPTTFDGVGAPRSPIGPVVLSILSAIDTDLFAFFVPGESIFCDHFATLAKALADSPSSVAASSGLIVEEVDARGHRRRRLAEMQFTDLRAAGYVDGAANPGRFVYTAGLIRPDLTSLFDLLDGEEHRFFRAMAAASGEIAQSAHATYVAGPGSGASGWESVPPPAQQQFIRDRLALDGEWNAMMARLTANGGVPSSIFAYAPGAPVRWTEQRAPIWVRQLLTPHVRYETRAGGNGLDYLVFGFSWPEATHVWVAAERAMIEFALPPGIRGRHEDLEIVLTVAGRRSQTTAREQHATVAINELTIGYIRIPDHETEIRLPIPKGLSRDDGLYSLQIAPDHAELVYDGNGAVIDDRHLSIMFKAFSVQTRLADALPKVVLDREYRCGSGGNGLAMLHRGFFPAEASFSFTAGNRGIMRFALHEPLKQPMLTLSLSDPHAHRRGTNTVRILVDNREALIGQVGRSIAEFAVSLDGNTAVGSEVTITIEVAKASAVIDANGEVVDGRSIGAALHGFQLSGRSLTLLRRVKKRAVRFARKVRRS